MPDLLRFFHPVLPAAELRSARQGVARVELGGRAFALFRDSQGRAAALDDVCPHRFAPLSQGRVRPDGRLACPYHGWNFDAEGCGRSPSQPTLAACDTAAYQIVERHEHLWLAGRDTSVDAFPDVAPRGSLLVSTRASRIALPVDRAFDALDADPQLAFARRLFGLDVATEASLAVDARAFDDRVHERFTGPQPKAGWLAIAGVRAGDAREIDVVTRIDPLRVMTTYRWTRKGTPVVRLASFLVPENVATTRLVTFVFLEDGGAIALFAASMASALDDDAGDVRPARLRPMKNADDLRRALVTTHYLPRVEAASRASVASRGPDGRVRLGVVRKDEAWSGHRDFVVAAKRDEGGDVCSIVLKPKDGVALPPFRPGQHLTLRLDVAGRARPVVRCYSMSDRPRVDAYRVSVKRAGVASSHLHDVVRVGDTISAKAPGGQFHVDVASSDPIVLVGAGVGVTPLVSMLSAMGADSSDRKPARDVWLFYGVRDEASVVHRDEIEAARAAGVRVHVFASAKGERVTIERLQAALPSSAFHFYVCGPNGLMEAITEGLLDWGVPLERIHFEAFGPSTVKKLTKAKAHGAPPSRAAVAAPRVTFRRSGVTATWDPATSSSLFELAEANGVAIETGCCVGSCGTCATRILAGEVTYASEPGESPPDGSCFACIATPRGDLEIDA